MLGFSFLVKPHTTALALAASALLAGCTNQTQPARPPVAVTPAERPAPAAASAPAGAASAPAPAAAGLTRHPPVDCDGGQHVDLVNVLIEASEIAVEAHGNCEVRIVGSHLVGAAALEVHGSATVTIEDSIVEGRIELHGNGELATRTTRYHGPLDRHGNAGLQDLGGNVWE
jgi:hypothetical protein